MDRVSPRIVIAGLLVVMWFFRHDVVASWRGDAIVLNRLTGNYVIVSSDGDVYDAKRAPEKK